MSEKFKVTIPKSIIDQNNIVSFAFGEEDIMTGARWTGITKGINEVIGGTIVAEKQTGPETYAKSRFLIIDKECPVTGDVILTLIAQWKADEK